MNPNSPYRGLGGERFTKYEFLFLKKKKSKKSQSNAPVVAGEIPVALTAKSFSGNYLGWIIAAFAFLLYVQSISFGYVLDDEASISKNHLVQEGFKGIPTLMVTDSWHGNDVGVKIPIYRPGSFVLFAAEWQLFPDNPAMYHLVNVILYALTCWLLFLLLTRLMPGKTILFPFICTLLYVAHPIHTEVVNNIKSADEMLCFLFALLASLSALHYAQERSPVKLILMGLFYFISVFSKETGIVFLVGIPMMLYFFTDTRLKSLLTITAVLGGVVIPYFLIRSHVLQYVPAYDHSPLVNALYATSDFISQRATALFILLRYEVLLLVPHPLSYNYDYAQIPIKSIANPMVLLSILIQLALAVYAFINFKKKNIVAFAILFFFLTMSPIANILLIIASTLGERLLYIPSLGFCMALTFFILKISKIDQESNESKTIKALTTSNPVLLISISLITLLYTVKTFTRSMDWKSNVTLFGHDVKISDKSATAHYHWGNALTSQVYENEKDPGKKAQYLDLAIEEYKTAINIFPDYVDAYLHIGDAFSKKQDFDHAIEYIEKYNEFVNYSNPDMLRYLVQLYDQGGQLDKGIAAFKTILDKNTTPNPEVLFSIGLFYNKKQDYADAIIYLDSCLHYNPNHLLALNHKAIADLNLQRYDNAIEACSKLISLDPNNQKAYTYLGVAYANLGNYHKAVEALEKAVQLDPNDNESKERLKVLNDMISKQVH